MPRAPEILILARQQEKVANLSFLLQLANFCSIHITDDIEAFNYLAQRQNSAQPIRLLVILDADSEQPILHLLDELKRRGAMLQVLMVRRLAPIPLEQLTDDDEIKALISQCESSITHACVQELLANTRQATDLSLANSSHGATDEPQEPQYR